jgi:hypothetical protein
MYNKLYKSYRFLSVAFVFAKRIGCGSFRQLYHFRAVGDRHYTYWAQVRTYASLGANTCARFENIGKSMGL